MQAIELEEAKTDAKRTAKLEQARLLELKKQQEQRDHIARYLAAGKNIKFQYQKKYAVD